MPGSVTEEVLDVIAETQRIPREKITIDGRFEELGMDSMDAVNILFALEEKFDITIPDEAAKQIRNIREMVEGVQKLVDEKAGAPEQAAQ
jgi:acyl carrier protein